MNMIWSNSWSSAQDNLNSMGGFKMQQRDVKWLSIPNLLWWYCADPDPARPRTGWTAGRSTQGWMNWFLVYLRPISKNWMKGKLMQENAGLTGEDFNPADFPWKHWIMVTVVPSTSWLGIIGMINLCRLSWRSKMQRKKRQTQHLKRHCLEAKNFGVILLVEIHWVATPKSDACTCRVI